MGLPTSHRPRPGRRRWTFLAIGIALLLSVSCTHLGYYSQSLWGGAKVLAKRRSVESLIADESTSPELRARLELAVEMREFAVARLSLPDNDSYRNYTSLDRQYAMWNVVASEELSIAPETWCFAIAGCVAYRGYFSEQRADRFAEKLQRRGYDVDVGGVAAYSTIGWFADPLLSTFIERPEPHLAGLIFHELAHQKVFVKGDTGFNESFAMAVEEQGAIRWLQSRGLHDQIESYQLVKRWEKEFSELIETYRQQLAAAYSTAEPDAWKRQRKSEIFGDLRDAYEALKTSWGGYTGLDGWFGRDLNNARLALIGVYHQLVPAFLALLESHQGQFELFFAEVAEIAALDFEQRRRRLEEALGAPLPAEESR